MTDASHSQTADAIRSAAAWLDSAPRVCASTGAGMSAESGVATFRDVDGLWARFNPQELATPEAFARDPLKVWAWYRARRAQLATVEPHVGHRLLAAWQQRRSILIITQNVDGLHHRAGSRDVLELHGRLDVARCTACTHEIEGLQDLGEDPHCDQCGQRLRPGVVWFGELLPPGAYERALDAVSSCQLLLVIGTSGVVQPAASLAQVACAAGARVVEINPQPTPISDLADACIRLPCGQALQAIDQSRPSHAG